MYTFRKATDEEKKKMTSLMLYGDHVYENGTVGEETFALFFGKVRRVFGEPDYTSKDWENMYSYSLAAEDGQGGDNLLLSVYHGPGGPAVTIPHGTADPDTFRRYKEAEKQLIELIESAEPVDYEWESVYEDIPVNVRYVVKNGKATVESEFGEEQF